MDNSSEDESSDSSNEFLVPANQLDLSSPFFKESVKASNQENDFDVNESSDDSDEEFDDLDDNNLSSAELLSQVLKNLESTKNQSNVNKSNLSDPSTSKSNDECPLVPKNNDLSKEINDLLLQGESAASLSQQNDDSDEETSHDEKTNSYTIPEKGVQIHLPGENFVFDKNKKKQQNIQKLLQAHINKKIRTSQLYVHKVGLLVWLAHGHFLNKLVNDPEILSFCLSIVSSSNYPKDRVDLKYLEMFTKWFTKMFTISEKSKKDFSFNKDSLLQRLSDKTIHNYVELILLYVATARGMGINCRLIISLRPPPLKPNPDQLFTCQPTEGNNKYFKLVKKETITKTANEKDHIEQNKKTSKSQKNKTVSPNKLAENTQEAKKTANKEAKKKAAAILKGKLNKNNAKRKKNNNDDDDLVDESNLTMQLRSREKKNDKPNKSTHGVLRSASTVSEKFSEEEYEFSTDDDYVEKKPVIKPSKKIEKTETIASKLVKQLKNQRKLLSSSDEDAKIKIKKKYNVWVEIYVESEESWISVDIFAQKIHCISEIYKKAEDPVLYVVAWNSDGKLKDVTRRYCPHWLTDTRKKRVDDKWWKETLSFWLERKTTISKAEDEQLLQRELEQPLPKTVGECKGHPLYALVRHLLKFEAIYPPDAVPLGHLKNGEAIYSRHCVHTLYSRETWIRRARVVKPAQETYKIVKSMPKYDKLSGQVVKNQPLELFGKWQTTPYIPPEAKDGKVPRNEYGNVDLFKMCMLPKGTVYLQLPGLTRIARKLDIDCAPAVVGFNFGCRGAAPAFDGFVVCKEFEDTLREAWEEEQVLAQKRATEKREKRIYGNWKKLIKGLLIRKKLAAKYNFKDEDQDSTDEVDEEEVLIMKKKILDTKTISRTEKNADKNTLKRSKHNASAIKKKSKTIN